MPLVQQQVTAFFSVHPEMERHAEARITLPVLFEFYNNHNGHDLESQLCRRVMQTARVGVKEGWAITYAFLDLIEDSSFTDELK